MILSILETDMTETDDKLDVHLIVTLSKLLLQSFKGYNSNFLTDFGDRITSAIKAHILNASSDVMRSVWKEDLQVIVRDLSGLQHRLAGPEQANRDTKILNSLAWKNRRFLTPIKAGVKSKQAFASIPSNLVTFTIFEFIDRPVVFDLL